MDLQYTFFFMDFLLFLGLREKTSTFRPSFTFAKIEYKPDGEPRLVFVTDSISRPPECDVQFDKLHSPSATRTGEIRVYCSCVPLKDTGQWLFSDSGHTFQEIITAKIQTVSCGLTTAGLCPTKARFPGTLWVNTVSVWGRWPLKRLEFPPRCVLDTAHVSISIWDQLC